MTSDVGREFILRDVVPAAAVGFEEVLATALEVVGLAGPPWAVPAGQAGLVDVVEEVGAGVGAVHPGEVVAGALAAQVEVRADLPHLCVLSFRDGRGEPAALGGADLLAERDRCRRRPEAEVELAGSLRGGRGEKQQQQQRRDRRSRDVKVDVHVEKCFGASFILLLLVVC